MSLAKKVISTTNAARPTGHFSQGIQVGNTVYVSGQLGRNKDLVLGDGIEMQTRLALMSIGEILKAAGATYDNVVKVTVLLTDINDFAKMNAVYAEYFKNAPPARICYQIVLPKDCLIEIDAIAVKSNL